MLIASNPFSYFPSKKMVIFCLFFLFVPVSTLTNFGVNLLEPNGTIDDETQIADYKELRELVCYTEEVYSCSRCLGVCVMNIYKYKGAYIQWEGGCQKPTESGENNKCSSEFGRQTHAMKHEFDGNSTLFGEFELSGSVKVYKKCCFTSRCNSRKKFMDEIMGLKYVAKKQKEDVPTEKDARITTFVFMGFVVVVTAYGLYWAFSIILIETKTSPDYRQTLDEKLTAAGKGSAETVDHGQSVSGQLSISETAEVILHMLCPPKIDRSSTSTSSDSRVIIVPPRQFQAVGNGHELLKAHRDRPQYLQSLLFRMIEHGPYYFHFKPQELLELFDEAMDVFQSQKSLVYLSSCVIFGDLRGSYTDLHRWLQVAGWPPKTRILFLGNTIDSEVSGSLEVIALISALKIAFPDDVFLLRGATESLPFSPNGRFPMRTANAIGRCISRMCTFLPTAAIVLDRILAVPSGITPLVESAKNLEDQPRHVTVDSLTKVQRHLIFNQPSTAVRMYRKNKESRGEFFGFTAVERIRADLNVNMLVRGGAPVPEGYCPCWEHSLVSLWSTPTGGAEKGAVLVVSKDLEVTPLKMNRQNEDVAYFDPAAKDVEENVTDF